MTFQFDGSREMWSTVSLAGALGVMFIYGLVRREYTRFWPILVLGILLNIATQVWFTPKSGGNPAEHVGMYTGFLLYPMYSMVAAVTGIMLRVAAEFLIDRLGMRREPDSQIVEGPQTMNQPYIAPPGVTPPVDLDAIAPTYRSAEFRMDDSEVDADHCLR